MPKVSVIIPVYNVENYLRECLDSVINQSLSDIEIICINDGSTDNSLNILKEYAQKDHRIKIISQENQGVGHARNIGMEQASSQYIMFLDSDDYYTYDACEKAYQAIMQNSSDICAFPHYTKFADNIINENEASLKKKLETAKENNYEDFQTFLWDKIYKKDFLIENELRICENLKTAEDGVFCWMCNFKKPKYYHIIQPLYVYRADNSMSATKSIDCIKNDIEAFKQLYNYPDFKNQTLNTQLKIADRFCSGALSYLGNFSGTKNFKYVYNDAKILINLFREFFEEKDLKELKNYKNLINFRRKNFIKNIFSIKNSPDRLYKIITIFGFQFKKQKVK